MGADSKIEWTHHTWNPWRGCAHAKLPDGSAHPGCLNCYAEAMAPRNPKTLGEWGENGRRAIGAANYWRQVAQWDRKAKERGVRERVFFASLADVFEDRDDLVEHRQHAFEIIDRCANLDFLILTKRPQNIRRMWPAVHGTGSYSPAYVSGGEICGPDGEEPEYYRPNVWLLTSVSDQRTADAMIPELLKCRDLVPVLGLSCEPLLGPIHLMQWRNVHDNGPCPASDPGCDGGEDDCHDACETTRGIDWVIVGGESGPGARPCNVNWIRSIRDQCEVAGVACFVKQLGNLPTDSGSDGVTAEEVRSDAKFYRLASVKDPKGSDWSEWPADLRVRQMPEVPHA